MTKAPLSAERTLQARRRQSSLFAPLALLAVLAGTLVLPATPTLAVDTVVQVKDINPTGGSDPYLLTIVNGRLFFGADDGSSGAELWTSDGTAAGTHLVKDIDPTGGSNPSELTDVNGTLFFTAGNDSGGQGLWTSDGTAAGTRLIKD